MTIAAVTAVPTGGLARATPARGVLLAMALCSALGCSRSVGPVTVRIETGGEPVSDFVLQYYETRESFEKTEYTNTRVAVLESNKPFVIEKFRTTWGVSGIVAESVHPEFAPAHNGGGIPWGGRVELPPIKPVRWRERMARGEQINFIQVRSQLAWVRDVWLPAFGNDRAKLEPYLPELSALIAVAHDPPNPLTGPTDPGPERLALEAELRVLAGES